MTAVLLNWEVAPVVVGPHLHAGSAYPGIVAQPGAGYVSADIRLRNGNTQS